MIVFFSFYDTLCVFFPSPTRTNIFCDKYDAAEQTYCKRLRVLCPEHTKEPKVLTEMMIKFPSYIGI